MLREKRLNPIAHFTLLATERGSVRLPAERRTCGILGQFFIELR